jgi:hypothetical protein
MRASDELLHSVTVWVTDIGTQAALLPSEADRAAFLAERCRELLEEACRSGMDEPSALIFARSCVEGAERIMRELLALGTPVAGGRA